MTQPSQQHNFYGITDEPANADALAFGAQVDGLTEFILQCPTPMTIAIQGGWGSGKSTILKLIDRQLNMGAHDTRDSGQRAITRTIETWPLAHTNSEEDIPAAFVAEVFDKVTSDDEKKRENRRRIFNTISPTIRRAFTNFAGAALGPAGSAASNAINDAFDGMAADGDARAGAQKIQNDFDREVKSLLEVTQPKRGGVVSGDRRLVIFVDDLDRLPPARAVQIMETLKLFINSYDCIFVLAIDFDVVVDGTKAIYGDSMSQHKAKMFFHKIIQVPFNVPSPGKQVEEYLRTIRKDWPEGKSLTPWASVSMGALDSNPRAIKRVFNAISLLKLIDGKQRGTSDQPVDDRSQTSVRDEFFDFCLFTILCIQNADDALATRLIEDIIEHKSYRDYVGTESDEQEAGRAPADSEDEEKPTQAAGNIWNEPIGHTRFTPGELLGAHQRSQDIFNAINDSRDSRDDSSEKALKDAAHLCSLTSLKQTPSSKEKAPRPLAGSANAREHFIKYFESEDFNWQAAIFDEIAAAFDQSGLEKDIVIRASSNERLLFSLSPAITLPKGPRSRSRKLADLRFQRSGGFTPYVNLPGFEYDSPEPLNLHFSESKDENLRLSFNSLEKISGTQADSLPHDARIMPAKNKGIGTNYELAQVHSTDEARRFAVFLAEHMRAVLATRVQQD